MRTIAKRSTRFITDFNRQDVAEPFSLPETFDGVSDEELAALHTQATEAFDALYGDGTTLSDEDVTTLATLTDGIESVQAEVSSRREAATERQQRAASLAARVRPEEDEEDEEVEDEEGDDEPTEAEDESAADTVTAAAPKKRRQPLPARRATTPSMKDVVTASADVAGIQQGQGVDWLDIGKMVDKRISSTNVAQFQAAARSGNHLTQRNGIAKFHIPFSDDLRITSSDPMHVEEVLNRAMDESRLDQGSLIAAGGWCAPSETIYDLCETESRDGLFSIPEISVARGGIRRTLGPDFASIFNDVAGFSYTEAEDIAGDYDGEGGGEKPCVRVDCPEFEDFRLGVEGLCLTAGLLQQKGYPEMIARTVRGATIAHAHRLSGKKIASIADGSTAVTMPTANAGTVAPLLTAIELQVEHMRYSTRMSRSRALEAVFPFWLRGAIRSDLARRDGKDVLAVTDAEIAAWFRSRGVNPQFVYNWQDITANASAFTAWPDTVDFLLYPSGTWVGAGDELITLDTYHDSTLVKQNDFIALFTEESFMVVKMCHDSRVVTVPLCGNGATAARIALDCDGVAVVAGG